MDRNIKRSEYEIMLHDTSSLDSGPVVAEVLALIKPFDIGHPEAEIVKNDSPDREISRDAVTQPVPHHLQTARVDSFRKT